MATQDLIIRFVIPPMNRYESTCLSMAMSPIDVSLLPPIGFGSEKTTENRYRPSVRPPVCSGIGLIRAFAIELDRLQVQRYYCIY
jgi:hypothetical protein